MADIPKNIKRRRVQLEMTQDELAKRLGYSGKSMVSKIEQGKVKLDQEKIEEIARILRMDPLELMGYKLSTMTEADANAYADWLETLTPTPEQARRDYETALISDIEQATRELSTKNLEIVSKFCDFLLAEQEKGRGD